MIERASDRWVSIILSVLLHGTLVAALAYGFWTYRQSRPPTPTLAIDPGTFPSSLPSAPPGVPPDPFVNDVYIAWASIDATTPRNLPVRS